jgi:hypothetical protein
MTIKHLMSDDINTIALSLDEDIYGANGDLDDQEIAERLIENIHRATDYRYFTGAMVPIGTVASLIRNVWEYKDRKYMNLICTNAEREAALEAQIKEAPPK